MSKGTEIKRWEVDAFRGLRGLAVSRRGHVSSQLDENSLKGEISVPLGDRVDSGKVNQALLVNAWETDPRFELDQRRNIWVVVTTVDAQAKNPVLKRRVRRTQDCPIPFVHGNVIAIFETIGA